MSGSIFSMYLKVIKMSKWDYVTLEDICRVVPGGTPKTEIKEFWNGNVPWITPKDLSGYNSRYISFGSRSISKSGLANSSASVSPTGSVLLSTRAPIGYIAIASSNVATNQGMKALVPKINTTTNFLFYLIKFNIPNMIHLATGSTFKEISTNNVKKLIVKIPVLSIQKAIASILSSLDDKIELNNKINKNLETVAQILYKRWFVDFEFPNEDGEPYKSSCGEMVESKLGLIPKGWEIKGLSDIAVVSSGKRPPIKVEEKTSEYKYPVIGASGVMAYTQEYNIDEKILIIGRVGTHGIVQRITEKVWASDNTLTIKSNVYEFVYQILNQIDYKSLNRGSTQPLITQTDINKTEILVPKSDLLEYFEKVVSSLFEVHKHNLIQNYKLSLTRDELLPKLMNGEIEVPIEGVN